jgi:hypothetical protein
MKLKKLTYSIFIMLSLVISPNTANSYSFFSDAATWFNGLWEEDNVSSCSIDHIESQPLSSSSPSSLDQLVKRMTCLEDKETLIDQCGCHKNNNGKDAEKNSECKNITESIKKVIEPNILADLVDDYNSTKIVNELFDNSSNIQECLDIENNSNCTATDIANVNSLFEQARSKINAAGEPTKPSDYLIALELKRDKMAKDELNIAFISKQIRMFKAFNKNGVFLFTKSDDTKQGWVQSITSSNPVNILTRTGRNFYNVSRVLSKYLSDIANVENEKIVSNNNLNKSVHEYDHSTASKIIEDAEMAREFSTDADKDKGIYTFLNDLKITLSSKHPEIFAQIYNRSSDDPKLTLELMREIIGQINFNKGSAQCEKIKTKFEALCNPSAENLSEYIKNAVEQIDDNSNKQDEIYTAIASQIKFDETSNSEDIFLRIQCKKQQEKDKEYFTTHHGPPFDPHQTSNHTYISQSNSECNELYNLLDSNFSEQIISPEDTSTISYSDSNEQDNDRMYAEEEKTVVSFQNIISTSGDKNALLDISNQKINDAIKLDEAQSGDIKATRYRDRVRNALNENELRRIDREGSISVQNHPNDVSNSRSTSEARDNPLDSTQEIPQSEIPEVKRLDPEILAKITGSRLNANGTIGSPSIVPMNVKSAILDVTRNIEALESQSTSNLSSSERAELESLRRNRADLNSIAQTIIRKDNSNEDDGNADDEEKKENPTKDEDEDEDKDKEQTFFAPEFGSRALPESISFVAEPSFLGDSSSEAESDDSISGPLFQNRAGTVAEQTRADSRAISEGLNNQSALIIRETGPRLLPSLQSDLISNVILTDDQIKSVENSAIQIADLSKKLLTDNIVVVKNGDQYIVYKKSEDDDQSYDCKRVIPESDEDCPELKSFMEPTEEEVSSRPEITFTPTPVTIFTPSSTTQQYTVEELNKKLGD